MAWAPTLSQSRWLHTKKVQFVNTDALHWPLTLKQRRSIQSAPFQGGGRRFVSAVQSLAKCEIRSQCPRFLCRIDKKKGCFQRHLSCNIWDALSLWLWFSTWTNNSWWIDWLVVCHLQDIFVRDNVWINELLNVKPKTFNQNDEIVESNKWFITNRLQTKG